MGEKALLRRQVDDNAIACILDRLHESRRNGRFHFPLAEFAEETALDPNTAESVMRLLE